jgi:hypothetical protein
MVLGIFLILVIGFGIPFASLAGTAGSGSGSGGTGSGSGGFEWRVPNPIGCDGAAGEPPILCVWQKIYTFIWNISFPIATIMILVGAWQILTAGGDPKGFETGKKTILYAVIGLAIVLVATSLPLLIRDILGV